MTRTLVGTRASSREFVLTARSMLQYALTPSLGVGCYHFSTRSSDEHDIINTLACRVTELEVFFAVMTLPNKWQVGNNKVDSQLSLRTISFSSEAAFMPLDADSWMV